MNTPYLSQEIFPKVELCFWFKIDPFNSVDKMAVKSSKSCLQICLRLNFFKDNL